MSFTAIDVEDDDGEPRPVGNAFASLAEQMCEFFSREDGRDPVLSRMRYSDYLQTDHWRALRKRKLLRAGGECQNRPCGYDDWYQFCWDKPRPDDDRPPVEVHHLTYARLGREFESDLIVLCRHCHAAAHGKVARP